MIEELDIHKGIFKMSQEAWSEEIRPASVNSVKLNEVVKCLPDEIPSGTAIYQVNYDIN